MISESQFPEGVIKIDESFRDIDKTHIRRTKNIRLIPDLNNRRGGKLAYSEWAHVIGIFQTLFYQNLTKKYSNNILDIGCGTGLLGIASEPFITDGGNYTGIDVMKEDIDFCRSHYNNSQYDFIHFDISNPSYADNQSKTLQEWPVEDNTKDLVTALSVWTHLSETDALFYFKEIYRVLKKGGRAIITFFILDEDYLASLKKRSNSTSRFNFTNQLEWLFKEEAYNSKNWFTTTWAKNPEDAIAISTDGINQLIKESGLKLIEKYPGNWKENPGIFFQDVLIFER
ncbi:class I SAM-dependent methyltransferase [Candidatus Kapabacteria bacterium]|nr:class I SAM-dependent methyltransferase [Candidatus Kapabacteria bacterium]